MITLGIDTSNYATSIDIIDNTQHKILIHKKEFLPVEQGSFGLRQQDALFHHTKNLSDKLSEIKGEFDFKKISAVGVSIKPSNNENSYMPCFLTGRMAAVAVSASLGIPIVETSHQTGHLHSALFYLNEEKNFHQEMLMLHISGGTTDVILAKDGQAAKTLGSSNDLFAGQAVDRLGVKMGYPFPSGEYVSRIALDCKEVFKPKISVNGLNCNLSGLENQCDKLLKDGFDKSYVSKYCLSFIAQTIIKMIENAQINLGDIPVVLAGGVMSSEVIRQIVTEKLPKAQFVEPMFSQDNAIGVAFYAYRRTKNG
ncbi:MAG: glycoprotease [Oscillospiraceae bacterium]